MIVKEKNRPENNYHCFEGTGKHLWREAARGMGLSKRELLRNSADGYRLNYQSDTDGYAMQTGGIFNPQMVSLGRGLNYWRFISTQTHRKYGPGGALGGFWWLSDNDFRTVLNFASTTSTPLAEVATKALFIPAEWGDCGFVVRARLTVNLKAWAGIGKSATAGISVANRERNRGSQVVAAGLPAVSLRIQQLFVPEPVHRFGPNGKQEKKYFTLMAGFSALHEFDKSFYC